MSGWNWALMALSGQCGTEMSLAGLDLAANIENEEATQQEEPALELTLKPYRDNVAAPVAQPG